MTGGINKAAIEVFGYTGSTHEADVVAAAPGLRFGCDVEACFANTLNVDVLLVS